MILDSNLDIGVYYDPLHLTATFMGGGVGGGASH